MTFSKIRRLIPFLFLLFLIPVSVVNCTSSDDDTSVLEEEIENMEMDDGSETMADDIEDLSDIAEEDLEDVVEEDDDSEEVAFNDDEEDFEDEEDELDVDESEVAEFDEEDEDDEFTDEDDEEVADVESEFDESEDDEFAEFDEMEEGEEKAKDQFAQNEKSLAEEMKGQQEQDYPVDPNAKPQFPEEVVDANQAPVISQEPPPGPLITSETQEISDDILDPVVPQDDLGMADPITPQDDSVLPEEPSWIPVVKIKTDPFFRNQRLMNAVYIVRPDDSMDDISQKLYGSDRVKELSEDNPHLAKGIDPGDKVYYNSPNRSDDRTALKMYYDDIGLKPQYYKTGTNDNMRRLGSKLLGFAEGWKEVWAINPNVDSKTILPSGIELKYWTGNESNPSQLLAQTETVDEPPPADPIEDDDPMGAGSVEDPFEEADLPPEPALPEAQIGADPTLEPEPVPDIEPFPEEGVEQTPPPQQVMQQPAKKDSLLSLGAIALLVMAGVGLVAIQIKKRRDTTGMNPASLEYTQV